jgi:hypothetical protein
MQVDYYIKKVPIIKIPITYKQFRHILRHKIIVYEHRVKAVPDAVYVRFEPSDKRLPQYYIDVKIKKMTLNADGTTKFIFDGISDYNNKKIEKDEIDTPD